MPCPDENFPANSASAHAAQGDGTADSSCALPVLRIVTLLTAGFVAAYIDRANISFAQTFLATSAGLDTAAFGLGAGLFFVGYVLAEIPANTALIMVGPRRWLSLILILWGVLSALTAYVSSPGQFYTLRFLLGLIEAGFFPGALYYLSRTVPPRLRATVTGALLMAIPVSGALGGILAGTLTTELEGTFGIAGWQWLFATEGLAPIVLGLIYLGWLPELPRLTSPSTFRDDLIISAYDTRVWHIGVIDGANLLSLYLLTFWLPYYFASFHVTDAMHVGLLSALPSLTATVCMMVNAWHSDRMAERRHHIAVPMIVGAAALMLSGLASSLPLFVGLVCISNAALLSAIPAYWSIPTMLRPGRDPAATIAVASSVANVAGVGATGFAGQIIALPHGRTLAFVLLPMLTIAVASSVYRLRLPQLDKRQKSRRWQRSA